MSIEHAFKVAKMVSDSVPLEKIPSKPLERDLLISGALLVMANRVIDLETKLIIR